MMEDLKEHLAEFNRGLAIKKEDNSYLTNGCNTKSLGFK